MSELPLSWRLLVLHANGRSELYMDGVRDPDAPCEEFVRGKPGPFGDCETDGHYICDECVRRDTCEGCGWRTTQCECEEETDMDDITTKPLTDEEIKRLSDCKNEAEWGVEVRSIKGARAGGYPSDWFPRVLAKGAIADRLRTEWGRSDALSIDVLQPEVKR